jgi:hypothetical protein
MKLLGESPYRSKESYDSNIDKDREKCRVMDDAEGHHASEAGVI